LTSIQNNGFLAGLHPLIVKLDPPQLGRDNLGVGCTQHGEQFLVKEGGDLGVAEFIGAKICDACGVPACQPTVITIDHLGSQRNVFGSRIESGTHKFDQTNISDWQEVIGKCVNASAFSAVFAIDLVLGNDDRHWNNWIVQTIKNSNGEENYRLRALDFSRSWPTHHPAQHPFNHFSPNTWEATRYWDMLGVKFDLKVFHETCSKVSSLKVNWLRSVVLNQLEGVFLSADDANRFADWWEANLQNQVIETINSLENGVWI
jgi:hypothetical protein